LPKLRAQILVMTLARIVLNTMHRMVYPFLAVFARGLGVNVNVMAYILTFRSLLGVFGPLLASIADSRGRKTGMLMGLAVFISGTLLVLLLPTFPAFILALMLGMIGKYSFDPTMQAYLGDHIPYEQRGRVVAITEMGWSLSFIAGIPLMGYLIARFGWRAPYPALALAGLLAFLGLARLLPADPRPEGTPPGILHNFRAVLTSKTALLGLSIGLLISAANEMINLVFGVWMEDTYDLRIASLGIAAAVIGLAELSGETLTALFTDRVGKPRAVGLGILFNCLAVSALPLLGRSLPGAVAGLFLFYITFEFTIVSAIPLMTELLPATRATLMASNAASLSIGRAAGALMATRLYTGGIRFNSLASLCLDLAALLMLVLLVKSMPRGSIAGQTPLS
jgi:MFS transporter, DHA1 family, inner membrane transport protein